MPIYVDRISEEPILRVQILAGPIFGARTLPKANWTVPAVQEQSYLLVEIEPCPPPNPAIDVASEARRQ